MIHQIKIYYPEEMFINLISPKQNTKGPWSRVSDLGFRTREVRWSSEGSVYETLFITNNNNEDIIYNIHMNRDTSEVLLSYLPSKRELSILYNMTLSQQFKTFLKFYLAES